MKYQVLLFYKYITISDPQALADWVRTRASELGLTGRAIIATEGINATFEGPVDATETFAADFKNDARFADVIIKRSEGTGDSFPKLSIKVRDEIVGTRYPKHMADPENKTAPRITAEELRTWYENNEDFVVVDMRNDYEFKSGHFKNSINPGLESSRELPDALPLLEQHKNKKVVTVCTGGIRCEKMSAYLMNSGFEDVMQLDNGIHGYMEKYPGKDFLGTLYTFDNRKTMHFGGEREIVGTCYVCEAPTEKYANCLNDLCHLHFLVCDDCRTEEGAFCSDTCAEVVAKV